MRNMGIYHGDTSVDYTFLQINNWFAIILAVLLISLPIFILLFYIYHHDKLEDEEFRESFGEVYEGMDPSKKSIIFYSCYFLIRRWLLVSILCWSIFRKMVWIQIHSTLILTMVQIIYLQLYMPFEETLVGRLDLFNEYTAMILLYHVFLFTSLVPHLTFQMIVGWSFVAFMCGNMTVHVFFLLKTTLFTCK